MSLTFNKTLKANLAQTVAQGKDEVHFTEDGETYTYKSNGTLLKVGTTSLTGLKDFKKSNDTNRDDETFLATSKAVKTVSDKAEQANIKAEQAFQSASNGKTLVASAITAKGVPTDASDTYQTMADNIDLIETSLPTQERVVMPTITDIEVLPDQGKSLSRVLVKGDPDLVGANIKEGVAIFGIDGTFQGGQLDISGQVTKTGVFMTDVAKGDTVKAKLTEGEFNNMLNHGTMLPPSTGGTVLTCAVSKTGVYCAVSRAYMVNVYRRVGEEFILIESIRPATSGNITDMKFSNDEKHLYISHSSTTYKEGLRAYKLLDSGIEEINIGALVNRGGSSVDVSFDDKYILMSSEAYGMCHVYKRDGDTISIFMEAFSIPKGKRVLFDKTGRRFILASSTAPLLRGYEIDEVNNQIVDFQIIVPKEIDKVCELMAFNNEFTLLACGNAIGHYRIFNYDDGNLSLLQAFTASTSTQYRGDFCFMKDYFVTMRRSTAGGKHIIYKRNPQTLLFEDSGVMLANQDQNVTYVCQKSTDEKYLYIINTSDIQNTEMYKLSGIETWIYKCTNNLDGSFSSFGYVEKEYSSGSTGQYIEHFNR